MDLVIQHLWKTYPNGTTALRDVSLTIPPGLFGLLGPNGAGKSTLMRILATLQEAEAGNARLGEIDVLRDHDAVRRTLGYLPQEFGLYPRVSAEDMLDHFGLLKGLVNTRERRETVHALLQQTNLYHARKQKLGSFSGGMRQRFGIAVALIGRPRLIIVDEPTAGLDPAERARFLNLLSELGESAVVILSTHIVEDVSELCTRMAIIAGGRILLEAEPLRAVAAMRGRVWRRHVDRAELPRYEQALPVISTTLVGGKTVIHVHADAAPDASFEPVEPDLKDVYFTVIRGISVAPGHVDAAAHLPPPPQYVTRTMDGDPAAPPVAPPPSADQIPPAYAGWSTEPLSSPVESSSVDTSPSADTASSVDTSPQIKPAAIVPSTDRSSAGAPSMDRPSADSPFAGSQVDQTSADPHSAVPPSVDRPSADPVVDRSAEDDRRSDGQSSVAGPAPIGQRRGDGEAGASAASSPIQPPSTESTPPSPAPPAGPGRAHMPFFGEPGARRGERDPEEGA